VVHPETDALSATRMLVEQGLPGLVVTDAEGRPLVILPGSQVLRFALPDYVEDDPSLAGVIPGKEYLPKRDRDRPIVPAGATALQVASVMSRQKSPVVAVVDGGDILGVITVHRLLGALLPPA
jgi:CBS domain-containing protein